MRKRMSRCKGEWCQVGGRRVSERVMAPSGRPSRWMRPSAEPRACGAPQRGRRPDRGAPPAERSRQRRPEARPRRPHRPRHPRLLVPRSSEAVPAQLRRARRSAALRGASSLPPRGHLSLRQTQARTGRRTRGQSTVSTPGTHGRDRRVTTQRCSLGNVQPRLTMADAVTTQELWQRRMGARQWGLKCLPTARYSRRRHSPSM